MAYSARYQLKCYYFGGFQSVAPVHSVKNVFRWYRTLELSSFQLSRLKYGRALFLMSSTIYLLLFFT